MPEKYMKNKKKRPRTENKFNADSKFTFAKMPRPVKSPDAVKK